ncbi:unnamed protein product, partial [Polarella glacialis]
MDWKARAQFATAAAVKEEPRIIWEDRHVAVLSKGPGWIVAVNRSLPQNKLYVSMLQSKGISDVQQLLDSGTCEHLCHYILLKFKDNSEFALSQSIHHEFGIAHRLDVDTSGAIMVGKTEEGFAHLRQAFSTHKVFKEYVCLVHGAVKQDCGEVDLPIAWDEPTNTSYISQQHGKWAKSIYTVQGRYRLKGGSKIFTLCRVVIITGRTHQIRLHMSSIGHPLVSDNKYNKSCRTDLMWCPRMFLHAWRIGFTDYGNQFQEVRSSLTPDLAASLRTLQEIRLDLAQPDAPSLRIVRSGKSQKENIRNALNDERPVFATGQVTQQERPEDLKDLRDLKDKESRYMRLAALELPPVVLPEIRPQKQPVQHEQNYYSPVHFDSPLPSNSPFNNNNNTNDNNNRNSNNNSNSNNNNNNSSNNSNNNNNSNSNSNNKHMASLGLPPAPLGMPPPPPAEPPEK